MSWRFITCAALFVTCLLTANTIATKLITVGGVVLTAGIVIFPLSYVLGDVLTEVWGYAAARRVIWLGFACNALMVVAIWVGAEVPPAPFWKGQGAYEEILGQTPPPTSAAVAYPKTREQVNTYDAATDFTPRRLWRAPPPRRPPLLARLGRGDRPHGDRRRLHARSRADPRAVRRLAPHDGDPGAGPRVCGVQGDRRPRRSHGVLRGVRAPGDRGRRLPRARARLGARAGRGCPRGGGGGALGGGALRVGVRRPRGDGGQGDERGAPGYRRELPPAERADPLLSLGDAGDGARGAPDGAPLCVASEGLGHGEIPGRRLLRHRRPPLGGGADGPRCGPRLGGDGVPPRGHRAPPRGDLPPRADPEARRARRLRRHAQGLRVRRAQSRRVRAQHAGARARRLRPALGGVGPVGPRHVPDLRVRLRGAEGGLAPAPRDGCPGRLLRPHRA